ncbi:MAG: hypothetical protein U1E22_01715, partial [Coriobacteriia bacterium]|nr:hypothetical protein [Coriobacteriia bacterium]
MKAKVRDLDLVPLRDQGGGDVFESQRLDAEEGAETEALVRGRWADQQDAHRDQRPKARRKAMHAR